jgi:hypothetical protein
MSYYSVGTAARSVNFATKQNSSRDKMLDHFKRVYKIDEAPAV